MPADPDVPTVLEVAKLLRLGKEIPHRRIGWRILFSRAAEMKWLEQDDAFTR